MVKSPAARLLLISLGFIAFVGTLLPGAYGGDDVQFNAANLAKMKKIDTNSDGHISWNELIELFPKVSAAEYSKFHEGEKFLNTVEYLAMTNSYDYLTRLNN